MMSHRELTRKRTNVYRRATHLCQDEVVSFLIAHRGHSSKAPENTMAAFESAVDAGFTWIETDADMLEDGTVVLVHDASFRRTGRTSARVSTSTSEDLPGIDVGRWFSARYANSRVPTLANLVDLMNQTGLSANVELKLSDPTPERIDDYIDTLIRGLKRLDPESLRNRVIISSFNHRLLAALHLAAPQLRLGCLFERSRFAPLKRHSVWRNAAWATGAEFIHPHHRELTRKIVTLIRAEGFGVNTWTVNNPRRAARLARWGVGGICTDGPKGMTPQDAPSSLRSDGSTPLRRTSGGATTDDDPGNSSRTAKLSN